MHSKPGRLGFTLIELVMVILLVGILAAIAIPEFIDFRTDAKNAAAKGALGTLRSALSVAKAAISLREATTTPEYPTTVEMQKNVFDGSHPILSGTNILDVVTGIPENPWSLETLTIAERSSVFNCSALTKSFLVSVADFLDMGWCYKTSTGQVWPNSDANGGATGKTENAF